MKRTCEQLRCKELAVVYFFFICREFTVIDIIIIHTTLKKLLFASVHFIFAVKSNLKPLD